MTANDLPATAQAPSRSSARRRYLALRSLISKILLLLVVFIAVPVILYNEFRRADQEKQVLLSESLQEQDRLMAEHDERQGEWFRAFLDDLFGPAQGINNPAGG